MRIILVTKPTIIPIISPIITYEFSDVILIHFILIKQVNELI